MPEYNRIKVVLVEKKRTNKELAKHLGMEADTVSKWARNVSQPNVATLFRIADFLDVSVRLLLVDNKAGE